MYGKLFSRLNDHQLPYRHTSKKEKSVKRIITTVIIAALMASAFSGCGKKNEASATAAENFTASVETVQETTAPVTQETTTAAETTSAPETTAAEPEGPVETPVLFHPLVASSLETGQQPDTNLFIYEVSYPEVHASESEAGLYPELNSVLFEESKKFRKEAEEQRNKFAKLEIAEEDYKHMQGAEIMRADSKVLSVKYVFSGWYGGAHADYAVTGRNYRTETGELLSAADVFKNSDDLAYYIKEELKEKYPDVSFFSLDETIDSYVFDALPDDQETPQYNFCLTGDGVVFWFNPYELASFADGMQVVMLQYDEYPELIRKEFRTAADAYTTYLDNDAVYTCSVGDIAVGARFNENGIINGISISIDGNEQIFETFAEKVSFMLFNNNEVFYIYAFEEADDDETFIDVYDINGGEAVYSGRFEGEMYREYDHSEAENAPSGVNASLARITLYSITDPESFMLESKDGAAEYHTGDDGMPEKK